MKKILLTVCLTSIAFMTIAFVKDKKRANSVGYYLDCIGICQSINLSAAQFTVTGINQAKIRTVGGLLKAIFSTRVNVSQCGATPLKFRP